MVDPTAFLRVPDPGILQGVGQGLNAIAQGQQMAIDRNKEQRAQGLHGVLMQQYGNTVEKQRRELDSDTAIKDLSQRGLAAWKAGDTNTLDTVIAEMAAVDPEKANAMATSLGTISRQNFVEAAQNILATAVVENPEAQNQQIDQAISKLNVGPNHPMKIELEKIKQMPQGPERDAAIIRAVEFAKYLGAYPVLSEAEKNAAKNQATAAGDIQKQVNVLRESLKQPRKIYSMVNAAKNRIDKIWDNGTGPSDLALIFNFMKMHDPESVVREAEFKTAQDARGVWESYTENEKNEIRSLYDKVRSQVGGMPAALDIFLQKIETGGRLTESQRQEMKNVSDQMLVAAEETYDAELGRMLEQADADQIPRERVVGSKILEGFNRRRQSAQPTQQAPQPGAGDEIPGTAPIMQPAAEPIIVKPNEQTAYNPETKQTVVFRDGQWLDVATGQPIQQAQ